MFGRSRTAALDIVVLPEPESVAGPQAATPAIATNRSKKAHIKWAPIVTLRESLEAIRGLHAPNPGLIVIASVIGEVDAAYRVFLIRNIASK